MPQDFHLKNLDSDQLQNLMEQWGEKRFHGKQIFAALFRRCVRNVNEMTDLPVRLRKKLISYEPFDLIRCVKTQKASDGTHKALFELRDGQKIESVWMPEETYATVCISTQVGCALGCAFCATGQMGFLKDLSSGEIIDQVIYFKRLQNNLLLRNLVFMGMGEPLLNYDGLISAIRILSASDGLAIAQRRMTVSTAGIVPGIYKLADAGLKVKLAISLNAPTDELRNRIMPINRKYPLRELLQAAAVYYRKVGMRITFEYTLMPGINDTPPMIQALRKCALTVPSKLNLIPLNPIEKKKSQKINWDKIFDRFFHVFEKERVTLTLRRSRGAEIQAACGQLAGKAQDVGNAEERP